ncbi:ATP-binding protein [Mucilaginibacter sp. AK015]|uniref:ATP-binding protein n=1 Tax=Mucilaginibacter sp. AK015 TaxID=2723072 RepID=UPI001612B80F|nr:ATP-binding protein [Mucilaginibacter sp. AK015]
MAPVNYHHPKGLLLCLFLLVMVTVAAAPKGDNKPLIKRITRFSTVDSARRYSDSLLNIAKKQNNKVFEAQILYTTSFKYYQAGEENTALDYARRAVVAISPKADSVTYVKARLMIAYMLSRSAQNEPALKEAFATLKITDKYGWRKLRIETKICIADIYRPLREINRALPFAGQAANEALALRDTGLYIFAASTLSNVYSGPKKHGDIPAENLAKAAYYLEKILNPPFEKNIPNFAKANYMGNLGRLYQMQGKPDKAEAVLLRSLDIASKYNYPSLAKHSLNELATLSIDRKQYKKAVDYDTRALAIQSGANSNRVLQRDIYNKLADAYAGLKDYKRAFDFAVKENRLNDSILTTDQGQFAAELDKKYQNDKRLLLADNRSNLLKQQRNFTIIAALFALLAIIAAYRWFVYKKRKEAAALVREHQQLAKIDAMKSRFFANISHELKTPLTLIMGPAEQLLQGKLTPEEHSANLQAITRNSKKLLNMVNELLDLGKIDSGGLLVKPQTVNLAAFIKLLFQGFASAAEYKGVRYTLSCNINENLHVLLDKDKFEKIANNFISNAIKFTQAGRSVNVVTAVHDDMIAFSVQDNGPGIHPDDLPQIFDRYYQGRQSSLNAEGGTGIGLSIAKEFAELMGGRVEIENVYGEGATFKAYIPLNAVTVQNSHVSLTGQVDAPGNAAVSQTSKLVLLVEDHDEMVRYVASVISPSYNIKTAGNGIIALQMLNNATVLPDLIISDVMMPEMDGFTLLSKLKEHPVYCRIPVIMLTALSDSRNKLRALNIGVDDYLTKPFIAGELLARTANLLANASGRGYPQFDTVDPDRHTISPDVVSARAPLPPSPADMVWLSNFERTLRTHLGKTEINITILSDEMAISERQLFRRIKDITGLTPNKYIRTVRLQVAREAIESGKYRTVAEISYLAGFETPAYFSKLFKEHYGREVTELL